MSWWEWLIVSIGLYVAAGLYIAFTALYFEGRRDEHVYVKDSPWLIVFLWPLFLCVGVFDFFTRANGLFVFVHKRGTTAKTRKLARQHKRAERRVFKEICHKEGWNYRKMNRQRKHATQ